MRLSLHAPLAHVLVPRLLATAAAAILANTTIAAEDATADKAWLAEHYTKYEHLVPMRDGVRLYTQLLVPKDSSQEWPILLTRTPYSLRPYGVDHFQDPGGSFEVLAKDRFIIVEQDVRGRHGSEGDWVEMRPYRPGKQGNAETDESSDTWDTIDWLVKNVPGNNGRAGIFGISYPGFYASMGMIDSHPALKAASPQAPIADLYQGDDILHNGAFFLAANFGFAHFFDQKLQDPLRDTADGFKFRTPDGYQFFLQLGPLSNADSKYFKGSHPTWNVAMDHPVYDDFCKARNIRPHLKNVRCAVMTVGGWFDAEDLSGALETYRWTERQNPGITNLLVMGPWSHGQWAGDSGESLGHVRFRSKTADHYRQKIELPFFRRFLKDDTNAAIHEAQVFETGLHEWRRFDQWPPRESTERTLHLSAGGALTWDTPKRGDTDYAEYLSDPARPVPHTTVLTTGYDRTYMTGDQRFASRRPDVLVFQTAELEEDLTLAGPLKVTLHVSTSGTDSDFVVKLIDVYPGDFPDPEPNPAGVRMGGYQQLVRGEPFRGKFRHSFERPVPFEPGKVERIAFTMPDILHTFRRGHRVMVQVQSSWFPLIDRNPQTFVNIPQATESDFRTATQRLYHTPTQPSALTVQVLTARTGRGAGRPSP